MNEIRIIVGAADIQDFGLLKSKGAHVWHCL